MVETEKNPADIGPNPTQYQVPVGPKTPVEVPGVGAVYNTPQSQAYKDHKALQAETAEAATTAVKSTNSNAALLSGDFLNKVNKTERGLENYIIKLNKFGKTEDATKLLRLSEQLADARVHHADPAVHGIEPEKAKATLTKLHEEAAQKVKEAKSQISKLRWEKAGNFVKSKKFLIPVAAVGAIAAASVFASKRNKQEREDEVAHRRQNTQELREDVAVLKAAQNSQPTLMGEQLREGEHAARVRAGRSNGAEPVINPANPPVDLNYQVVR
jgi:hypothetical protein